MPYMKLHFFLKTGLFCTGVSSQFTMLWQLQLSRKRTLSYVYMYPCSPISPSIQVPTKQWVGYLAFLWWQSVVPVVSLSGSDGKESAWSVEDPAQSLGQEDSPEKGNGYSLQYSSLENSMDRGVWQATVHGVRKHQTWLSD